MNGAPALSYAGAVLHSFELPSEDLRRRVL
jgi:hypothetical protein